MIRYVIQRRSISQSVRLCKSGETELPDNKVGEGKGKFKIDWVTG